LVGWLDGSRSIHYDASSLNTFLTRRCYHLQIRDYRDADERGRDGGDQDEFVVDRTSLAFSIMCMFLTVIYAAFAALTYTYSKDVLEEMEDDERNELQMTSPRNSTAGFVGGYDGYIGERFDVRRTTSGFVAPQTGALA
jgi:hypothetical protein